MSRPAESPGGLVNTEPAFWPPGWLARRQRTISAISASAAARSPGARLQLGLDDDLVGGDRRAPVAELERRRGHVAISSPPRGRRRGPRRGWRPCRSRGRRRSSARAPPTEPGTPTAHSKPVEAGRRRPAGDDRQARPRLPRRTIGAVDRRSPAKPSPSTTASPAKPASATSRFEPLPTTSTGRSRRSAPRLARRRRGRRRDPASTNQRGRAADPVGRARPERHVAPHPCARAPWARGRRRSARSSARRLMRPLARPPRVECVHLVGQRS